MPQNDYYKEGEKIIILKWGFSKQKLINFDLERLLVEKYFKLKQKLNDSLRANIPCHSFPLPIVLPGSAPVWPGGDQQ